MSPPPVERARALVTAWLSDTLPSGWAAEGSGFDTAAWQAAFLASPLSTPAWPAEFGGLGLGAEAGRCVDEEVGRWSAPVPITLVGMRMIGATLLEWGTPEQLARFMPKLATREEAWCQLFSEPGAGSDLASLSTRGVRDGRGWIINGQKVWCTFAAEATWGIGLMRTDPAKPKNEGITAFVVDLRAPGVTVRPLVQITGDAAFSEVFLDDVHVDDGDRLGPVGGGWRLALHLLSSERGLLGGGGASPVGRIGGISVGELITRSRGTTDPVLRDKLTRALISENLVEQLGRRLSGDPQASPLVKLAQTTSNMALQDLVVDVLGPGAVAYRPPDSGLEQVVYGYLRSKANTIAGGTSEVVRGLIGERMLGLPREPDQFRGVPWENVPRS